MRETARSAMHSRQPGAGRAPTHDLFGGLAEAMEHALILIGADGVITFVNSRAEAMFGYRRDELVGSSLDIVIPRRLRGAHAAGVARVAAGIPSRLSGRSVEVAAQRRDGTEFPIELSLSIWEGPDGMVMCGMMRDISERKRRDERLHRLAHHDALTGLANRTQMEAMLTRALERQGSATVTLIAIDGLRGINDNLGHVVGDSLLQALAIRLGACVDSDTMVARIGGDDFGLLTVPAGEIGALPLHAQRLLAAVQAPFRVADNMLKLDASIGLAAAPDHGADADELIAAADLALQAARKAGKGAWRIFDDGLRAQAGDRRALKDALRDALALDEFLLFFQPQVELEGGRITGAEALLRWRHPVRGMLSPGEFLGALETHTLALSTGTRILDRACAQAALWRRDGHRDFRVAVNLFAAQIEAGNLVETVADTLARHRLPPQALELEVTETIALKDMKDAQIQFETLKELGISIAFDDFGTGHASLNTLSRFPITTLKIDRGFVAGLGASPADTAIVKALIAIGADLGLEVIAEGIETEAQAVALRAMGCKRGQGFLFSTPLGAEAFGRLLAA